ncbi:uncharacterized protein LOC114761176 [Neltuma alba]|uniref:uncharacterized protein LOC114761176 n=1 Tax=Neltuma alba TaxID=207710 RepID=UPI0010A2F036|nr:uncharacterized protein LOC114761176 [Prosopis alba]
MELTDDVHEDSETTREIEPTEDSKLAEISLYVILGISSMTTMKVLGTILSREVLILIDSGSTHNFISEKLVTELKIPVQRFVHQYGQLARPLTDMTKKDAFQWSESSTVAFERLKQALTFVPNLEQQLLQDPYIASIIAALKSDPHSITHSVISSGGHRGVLKTLKRVQQHFYWRTMKEEVKTFVQNYLVCQQNKFLLQALARLLQPISVPDKIWEDISLDFIYGLSKSNGLMVVDRFNKFAHFIGLCKPCTADSSSFAPFHIVHSREPPSLLPFVKGAIAIADLEDFISECEAVLVTIRDNLQNIQAKMKAQADEDRRDVEFKIGKVAYELQLPPESRVHPIFHVSLLKPAHGAAPTHPLPPLPITDDWELVLLLELFWLPALLMLTAKLMLNFLSNGRTDLKKMLVGNFMICFLSNFPLSALRTRLIS